MWIIVELGDWAKLCYPDGSVQVFCNKELAQSHAEAISANNRGAYQLRSAFAPEVDSMHRLCVSYADRLKVRSVKMPTGA